MGDSNSFNRKFKIESALDSHNGMDLTKGPSGFARTQANSMHKTINGSNFFTSENISPATRPDRV